MCALLTSVHMREVGAAALAKRLITGDESPGSTKGEKPKDCELACLEEMVKGR